MKARQFIVPDCPSCGRGGVRSCINVRTGGQITTPHPSRTVALVNALYAEVGYLQQIIESIPEEVVPYRAR